MSESPTLSVERRPDGVAVLTLDQPGKPVNVLSMALVEEFEALLPGLLEDPAVLGLVLASAKQNSFIAGADLTVFARMQSASEAEELSRRGNALLKRLADQPKPVVAALHGTALGGGLEVALACHYLLASDHPSTVLALPETQLGVIPGGGGTQRLPRRLPLLQALPMLLAGKRVRAQRARRIGLVDAVTTPHGIVDTAAQAALLMAAGKLRGNQRRKRLAERLTEFGPVRSWIFSKAAQRVQRQTRGNYPAPVAALEAARVGLQRGIEAGLEIESKRFGELVVSPQARGLVGLFLDGQELKKAGSAELARPVQRLGVLGAGFMGSGIASVSLGKCPVVLRDIQDEVLGSAAREIDKGLRKQLRAASIDRAEHDRRRSRLLLTKSLDDLAGAELVIEAVFENLSLKRRVLAEAESVLADDAVFASNTSALPIADIAAEARRPERVLGMHYFSPVPKMPLLEIIVTDATAEWAAETARAFGQAQGKTVIVVRDGPGFYTTRILAPYLNEAILLLEEGARIEEVDAALKDWGFPVGPLALIDEIGIDVGAHVSTDLGQRFLERGMKPSDALGLLHEEGLDGRKSGLGLYRYPKRGRKKPNEKVYELLGGAARRSFDNKEVRERLGLLMVNEAVYCLQEQILTSALDGDIGAVMGLGFPPFTGGPFSFLDREGPGKILQRLEELAVRYGERFQPAPLLRETAARGGSFR